MTVSRFARFVLPALPLLLSAQTPEVVDFFEKSVRPLLAENCQPCHNDKVKTGGLDLKTAEGHKAAINGGFFGAPEKPEESVLIKALSYQEKAKMPPQGKLAPAKIDIIRQWLAMGAPWPGAKATSTRASAAGISAEDRKYWAFQPIRKPALPDVATASWIRTPVDSFVLAKLEKAGLQPPPPADRITLLRRATFDLTGLPPTEREVQEFVNDNSADAFKNVVDRLLSSPRYGERWGRHWLDVSRYADSTGSDEDHRYPHAWRYRDYVIEAFNKDMPYDQFVREQIAGDLLSSDPAIGPRGIVATGFLALGKKALAQRDLVLKQYDVVDDQIDVTSKALIGLTVSCARCHDHKFDPILQKDYYGLAAIFASTRSYERGMEGAPVETPLVERKKYDDFREHWARIQKLEDEIDKILDFDKEARQQRNRRHVRMAEYMLAAHAVYARNEKPDPNLDPAQLDKWIAYLKENRPELAKWHAATDRTRREAAGHYAVEFKQSADLYDRNLNWWIGARKNYPKAGKLVGPRPTVRREDNPFFYHVWLDGGPLHHTQQQQLATLTADKRAQVEKLMAEQAALERTAPTREIPMACAVAEGESVDQKLFIRGNHENHGESVPKSFLRVVGEQPGSFQSRSGRLELAGWLASNDNPLTARVMANRIWQWHFGEGLVRTPDNFGKLGELPTHPELLDYLAATFQEQGWSIKEMHRVIMLSSAYQMGGQIAPRAREKDPENRLLSRFPKRRLSIEELRDSLLAIGGSLDLTRGGTLDPGIGTDGETSPDRISMNPDSTNRRSVYLPLRRANLANLLSLFDFVDATNPTGKRGSTTVATQALFHMNSPFVEKQARSLADALLARDATDAHRVEQAFVATLARKPQPGESDAALSFVANMQQRWSPQLDRARVWRSLCRMLLAANEFIYVY